MQLESINESREMNTFANITTCEYFFSNFFSRPCSFTSWLTIYNLQNKIKLDNIEVQRECKCNKELDYLETRLGGQVQLLKHLIWSSEA